VPVNEEGEGKKTQGLNKLIFFHCGTDLLYQVRFFLGYMQNINYYLYYTSNDPPIINLNISDASPNVLDRN